MITYTVQLDPQEEGGYTVTVPALPGCVSEGDTVAEALANIQDAITGHVETLAAHGQEVPIELSELRKVDVYPTRRAGTPRKKGGKPATKQYA